MNSLTTGQFYGIINTTQHLEGLTLTDTEYTLDKVDWHYHENAYFTFILDGSVIEGNQKETYHCSAGSLLFHNWHEAHYNIKPKGYTRGFHIELNRDWFNTYNINPDLTQGSISLQNPEQKLLMYSIVRESKLGAEGLGIDALLTNLFCSMQGEIDRFSSKPPQWVIKLKEILHDAPAHNWTLQGLANMVNVHPIHLSRSFAAYFNYNLGDYIRMLRVQQSFAMLANKQYTLTEAAVNCGFADQSHFIRLFKALTKTTPLQYRNIFLK